MVSIDSVDFTPYKTFYEKYLQYPIFEPRERPDKNGPRLIPNNLGLDLSSYPVKPVGKFYQECFNNLINSMSVLNQLPRDSEEIERSGFDFFYYMQIFFEGISELRFYGKKRPNYYIFPTILESLVKTKLNFDVHHFMDKLLNSTPFVLNIPDGEFLVTDSSLGINKLAGNKTISSILVDFLPATEVLAIFKNISSPLENFESLKSKYLLTLNLWTSPMPINKHPGEIRSDTVCFLLDSKDSVTNLIDGSAFSKYAKAVIETTSADLLLDSNISSISNNTILNLLRAQSLTSYRWCMDFVGPTLLQKILSLIITSSMLLSDKSEWIEETELPGRPIVPSIQFLPESDHTGKIIHPKYHNREPCPCFRGQGRKLFMYCCKPRLKAVTLEPNDNFTIGENFEQRSGTLIPIKPHFQQIWHGGFKCRQCGHQNIRTTGICEVCQSNLDRKPILQLLREHEKLTPETRRIQKQIADVERHRQRRRGMRWRPEDEKFQRLLALEPEPQESEYRDVRDTRVVAFLKKIYDNTCQMCNYRIVGFDGKAHSQGAHILLFSEFPEFDSLDNIIILCPTHHTEFDYGAIRIVPQPADETGRGPDGLPEDINGYVYIIRHINKDNPIHRRQLFIVPEHVLNSRYLMHRNREQRKIWKQLLENYGKFGRIGPGRLNFDFES